MTTPHGSKKPTDTTRSVIATCIYMYTHKHLVTDHITVLAISLTTCTHLYPCTYIIYSEKLLDKLACQLLSYWRSVKSPKCLFLTTDDHFSHSFLFTKHPGKIRQTYTVSLHRCILYYHPTVSRVAR